MLVLYKNITVAFKYDKLIGLNTSNTATGFRMLGIARNYFVINETKNKFTGKLMSFINYEKNYWRWNK